MWNTRVVHWVAVKELHSSYKNAGKPITCYIYIYIDLHVYVYRGIYIYTHLGKPKPCLPIMVTELNLVVSQKKGTLM